MTLRFRKYSWQLAPAALRQIRQRVFVEEQKVPPDMEWDEADELAEHYIAVLPDNTPIAVARVILALDDTAHIGRMAVLPEHRGKGVGQALLQQLMKDTAARVNDLQLSAQLHAVPFYQRNGFHICSEQYDDVNIPHHSMRCLAPELVIDAFGQTPSRSRPMALGDDDQSWLIEQEQSVPALMDSLAGQAVQRIWLYDRLLDHDLYDRQRFRDILSSLARRHRISEVRLLIHDDKPLVKRRHQLVELMRRLPSHISLRLANPDYPLEERPFILADREGVLVRHRFDRPEGFANFADSGRVRLLGDQFQRMWDTARPSMELRELPI